MLLVIDVGNTNIVLGVYDGDELIANWRMTSEKLKTADEIGISMHSFFDYEGISVDKLDDVIISSVVPDIMYSITHGIRKYFGIDPIIVSMGMKTGINIRMQNPAELGSDRIVNIVGAYATYGGPAIIIDYGTANTYDVINEKGEFITGITAPGIKICADALYQRAAQLPKFEIKNPGTVIAKNTIDSMQVGITLGHVGETLYFIDRIKKELNLPNIKVIATGGLARVIDEDGTIFDVFDPLLTLKGLKILYEKNKKK